LRVLPSLPVDRQDDFTPLLVHDRDDVGTRPLPVGPILGPTPW
jgi:hypothetical protein